MLRHRPNAFPPPRDPLDPRPTQIKNYGAQSGTFPGKSLARTCCRLYTALEKSRVPKMDAIPILSQLKSLVQVIGGDEEGARKTQQNFSRQMPVVSQMRSLVEVSMGDAEAALETQRQFGQGMNDLADAIPGVGHVKGGIHYAVGDTEGGDRAMKSSSHTLGVMGGGVAGFVVGGPVGAIAGGVAGGAAMDTVTTVVDSNVQESIDHQE